MGQYTTYAFGAFRLDTATQLLWQEATSSKLTPKIYRLLLYFLQHPDRLITHQELLATVWDGRIVENSALRLAVNGLRHVLQDESKSPCYISTVCKRGYRFLAAVSVMGCSQMANSSGTSLLPYQPQIEAFSARLENLPALAELKRLFLLASSGTRCVVFLHGEPRIGKTALLDTFLAQIQQPALNVLQAHCVQLSGVTDAFLPLLEALESQCREPSGGLLIERLDQLAPTWLYQMLTVLDADELAKLLPKIAHINASRMLLEGAEFIESLSKDSTFILIVDNAHWCDERTLDLLNFLMFRCVAARLLVIVSYRSYDEGAGACAKMQAELSGRGLCQELAMQKYP